MFFPDNCRREDPATSSRLGFHFDGTGIISIILRYSGIDLAHDLFFDPTAWTDFLRIGAFCVAAPKALNYQIEIEIRFH